MCCGVEAEVREPGSLDLMMSYKTFHLFFLKTVIHKGEDYSRKPLGLPSKLQTIHRYPSLLPDSHEPVGRPHFSCRF